MMATQVMIMGARSTGPSHDADIRASGGFESHPHHSHSHHSHHHHPQPQSRHAHAMDQYLNREMSLDRHSREEVEDDQGTTTASVELAAIMSTASTPVTPGPSSPPL